MSMKLKKKVKELTADDVTQGTDITALKTTVGNSSSGLVKDVTTLKSDVGASDTSDNSLKKRCKTIETAIGTESTEGSILYRIKQLENANSGGSS